MYLKFLHYARFLIDLHTPLFSPNRSAETLHRHIKLLEQAIALLPSDETLAKKLKKASTRLRIVQESRLKFSNSKGFYQYVNKRIRSSDPIAAIVTNGRTLIEERDQATAFANYFASVFVSSEELQASSQTDVQVTDSPLGFVLTIEQILVALRSLKLKCSLTPDGIPPIFYRLTAPFIAEPLFYILERSLNDSQVPSDFLKSVVTLIFKKRH